MITVVRIINTCQACPSQWEGATADGRVIYVRYRWGNLRINIGPQGDNTLRSALHGDEVVHLTLGGDLDGSISYDDLRAATAGVITWPDAESPEEDATWVDLDDDEEGKRRFEQAREHFRKLNL